MKPGESLPAVSFSNSLKKIFLLSSNLFLPVRTGFILVDLNETFNSLTFPILGKVISKVAVIGPGDFSAKIFSNYSYLNLVSFGNPPTLFPHFVLTSLSYELGLNNCILKSSKLTLPA
jgi:hypothetical protein